MCPAGEGEGGMWLLTVSFNVVQVFKLRAKVLLLFLETDNHDLSYLSAFFQNSGQSWSLTGAICKIWQNFSLKHSNNELTLSTECKETAALLYVLYIY